MNLLKSCVRRPPAFKGRACIPALHRCVFILMQSCDLVSEMQARTIAGIAEQVAGSNGGGSLGRPSSAKDRSIEVGPIPATHNEASLESGVPASYSQEMLIFNNELDPFNPAHNEPFWVKINGGLNGETFMALHPAIALVSADAALHFVAGHEQLCGEASNVPRAAQSCCSGVVELKVSTSLSGAPGGCSGNRHCNSCCCDKFVPALAPHSCQR